MLLEFRVKNFRSIRDEQVLSLIAGRDRVHPQNLHIRTPPTLKVAALYGANASGKSNLFRAFRSAHNFIVSSATKKNAGDATGVSTPFALDSGAVHSPSQFGFVVDVGDFRFEYGFSADKKTVHSEWLSYRPTKKKNAKKVRLFQRDIQARSLGTDLPEYKWVFGTLLSSEDRSALRKRTRSNGLALSRAGEQNVTELIPLYLWFSKQVVCLDMASSPRSLLDKTTSHLSKDGDLQREVLSLLKKCELPIVGFEFDKQRLVDRLPVAERSQMVPIIDAMLKLRFSDADPDVESMIETVVNTHHKTLSGEQIVFKMNDESQGTQRLFALSGPLSDAIQSGLFLFVDEMDASLHPLLTRKLVETFHHSAGRKGAQLVFTTHDTSLFRSDLFRRDQIYLAEADSSGASRYFSLAEFKRDLRSDEDFEKNYLLGRYGGVPALLD